MKRLLIGLFLSLLLLAAALVGAQVIVRTALPQLQAAASPSEPAPVSVTALAESDVLASLGNAVSAIYDQVSPSVVYIEVTQEATLTTMRSPWGRQQQQTPAQKGSGTGFIWDQAGHIVTNNHVVEDADIITVTFADGMTAPATVVGTDPNSDLAVIKVDVAADELATVTMGDSTQVKVGQVAIAIGNPFGLENTMTVGFVSAIGRSLPVDSNSSSSYSIPDVIQTDASINPGNSGGVLLNSRGQVIGVTSAIISPVGTSAGIGFAVPAAAVNRVVPELIEDGTFASSWLGISGSSLNSELATAMDLDSSQRGVLVGEVVAGGPADKARLQAGSDTTTIDGVEVAIGGDVITAIDGQATNSFEALVTYLARSTAPGQKVVLTILRAGKEQTINVTLGERPAATPEVVPTQSAG